MLLCLDVGLANMGYSVFDSGVIIDMNTIKTEKAKKKGIRVADDNAERAIYVATELQEVIEKYKCQGIIGELPSGGSQNAQASNKMGIATGIASTLVGVNKLPCEWCTPINVKKVVTGKNSATKEAIMEGVCSLMGWDFTIKKTRILYHTNLGDFNKGTFEHIADSIGAYLALKNNNLVKMFG